MCSIPQVTEKYPTISGRFEFLHKVNLAWILSAGSRLRGHQKVMLRLFPGRSEWFIAPAISRKKYLEGLNLPVSCQLFDPKHDKTDEDAPKPGIREQDSLLNNYFQEVMGRSFFPDSESLLEHLRSPAQAGKRVVTTNGCFDILHPGHLETLKFAKSRGDVLIVAINSDDSIRNFKGNHRPIHDELFRGAVLAHLTTVDFVTIFRDDTPLNLLSRIQPTYHVKGGSFIESRVRAEKDLLAKWGGEFLTFPMKSDYSTSRILDLYTPGVFPV